VPPLSKHQRRTEAEEKLTTQPAFGLCTEGETKVSQPRSAELKTAKDLERGQRYTKLLKGNEKEERKILNR